MPKQNSAPVATTAGRSNDAPCLEIGECQVSNFVATGTCIVNDAQLPLSGAGTVVDRGR